MTVQTMRLADVDVRAGELALILQTMPPRFESWDVLDDPRVRVLFAPFVHLHAYRSLVPRWMHVHLADWQGRLLDPTNRHGRGATWDHRQPLPPNSALLVARGRGVDARLPVK